MLVLAHGLIAWRCNRRDLRYTALLFALWLLTLTAVHIAVGEGVRYWTLERILEVNLQTWPEAALKTLVFGGVWACLAWKGYRGAHPFAKALAWLLPVYAALFVVGGHWFESRLWTVTLPLVMALTVTQRQPR